MQLYRFLSQAESRNSSAVFHSVQTDRLVTVLSVVSLQTGTFVEHDAEASW